MSIIMVPCFLGGCERVMLEVIKKFKNKNSHSNNIDTSIIKTVFESKVEPFTYICNLSFLTGTFPEEKKLAKIFLVFKMVKSIL